VELAFLRDCLCYDRDTGEFRWLSRPEKHFASQRAARAWNSKYAGTRAGTIGPDRRVSIHLSHRLLKAHRLAWLFETGRWPDQQIDHINGNPGDNRIENLREATNTQNQYNRGANKNNTSGHKGVCWDKPRGKWRAQIVLDRKSVFLGHYETAEAAGEAYRRAAEKAHGAFAQ
jgi:hypothetical protein